MDWTKAWLLQYGEPIRLEKIESFDDFTPNNYTEIYINEAVEGILCVGCSDCMGYLMSEQTYWDLLKHHGIYDPPKHGEWGWDTRTTVSRRDNR